jgi:acetyl-CoA decarbonylase/synthase complex subunit gamma
MEQKIDLQTIKPIVFNIPVVETALSWSDYLGAVKVRWGIGRDHYRVAPGLYKTGHPGRESDVFVSANYKLSFDVLRKNLNSMDAWILVIDTKGVNVWCAAGKGTFATDNLVKSIKDASLDLVVKHRRIIVPQLGAPGIAAHLVKELTGFRVLYGPVRAKDIRAFVEAGYKAGPEMRKVRFNLFDRAKLIPVDLMYRKYYLSGAALLLFFFAGLDRSGFLFSKMTADGAYPLINLVSGYLAGVVLGPLFLPLVPFRAFAIKGAVWGLIITLAVNCFIKAPVMETFAMGLINLATASFMTMNFTGSSTYTSLSGVQKEMKWALPFQIAFASAGFLLFILSKLI